MPLILSFTIKFNISQFCPRTVNSAKNHRFTKPKMWTLVNSTDTLYLKLL